MKKVIMTKGLPGSGKTIFARDLINKNPGQYKRINKDDLRALLDNGKWSKSNEKFVLLMRDTMAISALEKGWSVIIDDTNLHPKHEINLEELAKEYGAEFEIKDFTEISLEQCIKWDLLRTNSVGSKVIMDMYNQFLKPKPEVIGYNPELTNAIICDIDGTLALFEGNPYERDFSRDEVNTPVASILNVWEGKYCEIILVSGRNNKFVKETIKWLNKWSIHYDHLFMPRNPDDQRKDFVLKKEIYDNEIKDKYNVLFVLDDRNQVVDLWRSLGLTCLQVASGDF